MTPDDDQGAPPHWFAERATARYPNGWRYLCDDPEREHGYNPALGGIVHRDDYSACGWGLAPTALAPGEGDAKPGGNPAAPDDLQEQIERLVITYRHDSREAAIAVMDVLRQHQGRVRAETLREVAVECALEHDAGGYVVVQMTAETWHELSAVREAPR